LNAATIVRWLQPTPQVTIAGMLDSFHYQPRPAQVIGKAKAHLTSLPRE
jgi:hypothetical protein